MLDISIDNVASTNVAKKNAHFQNQTTERDFMTWNIQRLVCDLDGSNSYRATVPHYLGIVV